MQNRRNSMLALQTWGGGDTSAHSYGGTVHWLCRIQWEYITRGSQFVWAIDCGVICVCGVQGESDGVAENNWF